MQPLYWKIAKLTWLCVLVLMMGTGGAIGAESVPPQNEILSLETASAAMDSEFSYQGMLKNNGTPVNGIRNFTFQIHDNVSCTSQLEEIVKTAVPVVEGRFSVSLLVRQTHFNGQKLWLQVVMGASTRLMCEEILAVPYALSVKPGAEIKNTLSEITINYYDVQKTTAIGVDVSASGGTTNYGIRGSIDNGDGAGVYAVAGAASSRALYARNNQGGTAGDFYGDVTQNVAGNGVVKAGIVALCSTTATNIYSQFGPQTISITNSGKGRCTIDFSFDITARYWSAAASDTAPRLVTCHVDDVNDNALNCFRTDVSGMGDNGRIVILIY